MGMYIYRAQIANRFCSPYVASCALAVGSQVHRIRLKSMQSSTMGETHIDLADQLTIKKLKGLNLKDSTIYMSEYDYVRR
jgi:hypothetical protein